MTSQCSIYEAAGALATNKAQKNKYLISFTAILRPQHFLKVGDLQFYSYKEVPFCVVI